MSIIKAPSLLMKKFLKREIGDSKRVLDIGCGDGVMALYLISSLNCHIDGVDLDKGKIHRANEKLRKGTFKGLALCHLCDSKFINKKFKKETFDAVLIVHVLHHLTELSSILSKIRRVLKIGGKIFIEEYNPAFGEKLDNCPRFSSNKIKSMLNTARFRDIIDCNIHKKFIMITAVKGRINKKQFNNMKGELRG